MIGLYSGLRREEILALQWDCVFLDEKVPCISVQRAWHSEHNRPVIGTELKTPAARRNVPIPIAIFKNKANSRRNGTSLSSQKAKLSEKHIVSHLEGHPASSP